MRRPVNISWRRKKSKILVFFGGFYKIRVVAPSIKGAMRFLVIKSKAKLGSTMIVVKTKKIAQLRPVRQQ